MQGDRHMTQSSSIRYIFSIWSAALLLAGNMIGSGLLALPICIGIAGTSAALFGLVVVWLMMLLTGLVIAYHTTQMGRRSAADIPSFFNAFLGVPILFYGFFKSFRSSFKASPSKAS